MSRRKRHILPGGARRPRPTGCAGLGRTEPSAPTGGVAGVTSPTARSAVIARSEATRQSVLPLPPSAREVAARSADGGRDKMRHFLSPSRLRRQPPPRGGLTTRQRRAVIARRAAPWQSVPPPTNHSSKSQQLPAKFCAPIQNVKISPETVADSL